MKTLVVGAGPTGLTTALELARLGMEVDIIDKRSNPSGYSRAVGILPHSLALLKPSGATDALLQEGRKINSFRAVFENGHTFDIPIETLPGDDRFILALPQDKTETILASHLEKLGYSVRYSTTLTDLSEQEEKVHAQFNETITGIYDYVVACDGIRSTCREILDLPFPGTILPAPWSIADVELEHWNYTTSFNLCLQPGGIVAIVVPIAEKRVRIISNTENAIHHVSIPLQIKKVRREGSFNITVAHMENFRHGRVLFAGDAAHAHSPVGGRGMNLGIADAVDAAKRIAEGEFESYGPERLEASKHAIKISERGRKFLTNPSPLIRFAARLGFRTISSIRLLRKFFVSNFIME